jgi:hypothetical protein
MNRFLSLIVFSLSLIPSVHADSSAACLRLKTSAAANLGKICAQGDELTTWQIEQMNQTSELIETGCGEADFAQTLARGLLYRNLGLIESCKAKASVLVQSL